MFKITIKKTNQMNLFLLKNLKKELFLHKNQQK